MLAEETLVGFFLSLQYLLGCLRTERSSSATLRCGVASAISPCVCPSANRSGAAKPEHGSRSSQRHSSAAADVGCAWCSGTASICRSCGLLSTFLFLSDLLKQAESPFYPTPKGGGFYGTKGIIPNPMLATFNNDHQRSTSCSLGCLFGINISWDVFFSEGPINLSTIGLTQAPICCRNIFLELMLIAHPNQSNGNSRIPQ